MEAKTMEIEICPTTAQEWIRKGALLVDVREKDEVRRLAYDVPDIVNIPLSEFEDRFTELPKDRDIVMVCLGGGRSLKATYFLRNHGYLRVVNMQHGMKRWVQKGFPTIGNPAALDDSSNGSCCGPVAEAKQSCCDSPNSDGSACC
ncbi:MAG: rhodanese-like domain-containing protein [Pyrinomonadaceae bacterium]